MRIAAARMIARWARSPSSPAPAARRCAALGLDRSMRPNKPAAVPTIASLSLNLKPNMRWIRRYFHHRIDQCIFPGSSAASGATLSTCSFNTSRILGTETSTEIRLCLICATMSSGA